MVRSGSRVDNWKAGCAGDRLSNADAICKPHKMKGAMRNVQRSPTVS
jgi:hypothetical protein